MWWGCLESPVGSPYVYHSPIFKMTLSSRSATFSQVASFGGVSSHWTSTYSGFVNLEASLSKINLGFLIGWLSRKLVASGDVVIWEMSFCEVSVKRYGTSDEYLMSMVDLIDRRLLQSFPLFCKVRSSAWIIYDVLTTYLRLVCSDIA